METATYDFGDLIVAFRSPRPLAWASEPILEFGASVANAIRRMDHNVETEPALPPSAGRRIVVSIWSDFA